MIRMAKYVVLGVIALVLLLFAFANREIVSVSAEASLDDVLKTMVESQHSRLCG